MREPLFAPLQAVLAGGDRALGAWALAGELAAAFEKYQAWRRDWLLAGSVAPTRTTRRRCCGGVATRPCAPRRAWTATCRVSTAKATRPAAGPAAAPVRLRLPERVARRAARDRQRRPRRHAALLSSVADPRLVGRPADRGRATARRCRKACSPTPRIRCCAPGAPPAATSSAAVRLRRGASGLRDAGVRRPGSGRRARGLLHRLQRDLLERAPPRGAQLPLAAIADPSLQVHACHTRLREVQVLHDQLRALLETRSTRRCSRARSRCWRRTSIRTCPSSSGVRRRRGDSLADSLRARRCQPAGRRAAGRGLPAPAGAAASRFGADEMLDLLAAPALAERPAWTPPTFERLHGWLAPGRRALGPGRRAPRATRRAGRRAYTWAFALDRLLLGHASGSDDDIAGVAPLPELEGGALGALDRCLQGLLRVLAPWHACSANARAAGGLARAPGSACSTTCCRSARTIPATASARWTACARWSTSFAAAGRTRRLRRRRCRPRWCARICGGARRSRHRAPLLTGGVSFGRMVPMRLLPFRVICLLGMNDGDFPRRDPAAGLNRLTAELGTDARRRGDRSMRDDDRYLFLQLFAAAQDVFYLSYLGADPRDGSAREPSVLVSELLDVAARYFDAPARAREACRAPAAAAVLAGGLWRRRRADARRFGFQGAWRAGAAAALGPRAATSPLRERAAAGGSGRAERMDARAAAASAGQSAARVPCAERLGLRLPASSERLPEAEPFALDDGLDRWQRDGRVLDLCLAQPELDEAALRAAPARRGPARAGRRRARGAGALARRGRVGAVRPGAVTRGRWFRLPYTLELGGFRLNGVLPRVHPEGLRAVPRQQGAWQDTACARAGRAGVGRARPRAADRSHRL